MPRLYSARRFINLPELDANAGAALGQQLITLSEPFATWRYAAESIHDLQKALDALFAAMCADLGRKLGGDAPPWSGLRKDSPAVVEALESMMDQLARYVVTVLAAAGRSVPKLELVFRRVVDPIKKFRAAETIAS